MRVAVFCGSSAGVLEAYEDAAYRLGRELAAREIGLVFGGGGVGLMGAVSSGALAEGGEVIGVIPDAMVQREWGRTDIDELRVVASMHERKELMYDLSDAFVILPGGLGTWDEFFEIATWRQLGLHDKPIYVLNVEGYYEPLSDLLLRGLEEGFVTAEAYGRIEFVESIEDLLLVLGS